MRLSGRRRWLRAAFVLLASVWMGLAFSPVPASAEELTQYFPAAPAGRPAARRESGWKITWQVLEAAKGDLATHGYGGSAVWEIRSVDFMRGYKADGSEDWVRVLNKLAMAEMYVPYHNNKTEFFDIAGFKFNLVRARRDYLPGSGLVSARLHNDGYVISEVADDHVRWIDNDNDDQVRRGQTLHLWATFDAGNYRYVLRYGFADDGTISVRVGGTAENFFDLHDKRHAGMHDHSTHIHMAAWRMEFNLGNAETNTIEMVERETDANNKPSTRRRPFNAGREGGEVWDAVKFSVLKITSGQTKNRAEPPRDISYTLRSVRTGSVRTKRLFTTRDFWVSRLRPDSKSRSERGTEYRFVDVPGNVLSSPEPIEGKAVVIWHQSGINHIVRSEDYGVTGSRKQGVAITAWTGFDLVPADLWHKTPFLERPPPPPMGERPPGPK